MPGRRRRVVWPALPIWLAGALALGGLPIESAGRAQRREGGPTYRDIAADVGLDFAHVNGSAGALLLPEVIGAGGALFDMDNDGDLDLLAVQSGALSGASAAPRGGSRLYRNDLDRGRLRFTDVTARSGLATGGYGIGVATGDVDNDGFVDVYVASLGANQLFRNNGDGTFRDMTAAAGVEEPRWSTSATFFDYDADGWLDLFVANYVGFRPDLQRACFSAGSARDYCNPSVYAPTPDRLFHNRGDGTFVDVSARAGITQAAARGLGVLAADFNRDGWTDVYVANDGDANQLWLNAKGSGRFTDGALLAGVAVNRTGQPQGSMGIDVADVDGDGDDDLFVTNLDNEGNTFYRNVGAGLFEDRTVEVGLFALGLTGFGTRFLDFDNDGWLDVLVANGAVRHIGRDQQRGDPYPLKQPHQLFRSEGGRRFTLVSPDTAGPGISVPSVGRGIAVGDVDNDGGIDVVVFNNNGPLRLLRNEAKRNHWIGLHVVDRGRPRDAVQATVTVVGGPMAHRRRTVHTDGSYAASSDPRVLFGLGPVTGPQSVRVLWPGGHAEEFGGLAVDRYWELEAGRAPRAR